MTPQKSITETIKETIDETRMTFSGSELRHVIQTALCLSDFDNIPVEQKTWLEKLIMSSAFASHQQAYRESPQTAQQQPGRADRISDPNATHAEDAKDRNTGLRYCPK